MPTNSSRPLQAPILGMRLRPFDMSTIAEIHKHAREMRPVANYPDFMKKFLAVRWKIWRARAIANGMSVAAAEYTADCKATLLRDVVEQMRVDETSEK